MFKTKKAISFLLVISLLAGIGLFNASSIVAFADESADINEFKDGISYYEVDNSNPFNPRYYDEFGRLVDFNDLLSGLADSNSSYGVGALPAAYDARKDNLITAVKNQSSFSTCWAHATLSCLETNAVKKGYMSVDDADFSEAHLAWFEKNPVDSKNNTSANDGANNNVVYTGNKNNKGAFEIGGWGHDSIATLSRQGGIALEKDFPYSEVEQSNKPLYGDEKRFDTGSGLYVDTMVYFPHEGYSAGLDIMSEVKAWVRDYGAATIDYYHDPTFFNEKTNAYYCPSGGGELSNHDVQIVGWNDNYSRNNFNIGNRPERDGAWLIKNSWGSDWGDHGFFWLSYESLHVAFNGYEVKKRESGTNQPYTYNGIGAHKNYIGLGTSDFFTANVFEAKNNEALSKVSFYTAQPDLNVNVRVYKLEEGYRAPISGDLVYTASEYYHNIGYHTLDLKSKVNLAKDQLFSVVVEYTTKADVILLHAETNYKNNNTRFKSNKGESWFGFDGNWLDTSVVDIGNCYIDAITVPSSGASDSGNKSAGRISVLPSEIVMDEGETKAVNVAFSPWKTGNYVFNVDCKDNIISCEAESALTGSSSPIFNGIAKLNVKGLKAGTTEMKIGLVDKGSGKVVDTATINVTVKATMPNISAKLNIVPSTTVDYRAKVTLVATASYVPNNCNLVLYEGNKQIAKGNNKTVSFSIGEMKSSKKYVVKIVDAKGNVLKDSKGNDLSANVEIKVKSSFFDKIIAFFRGLFGSLPDVEINPNVKIEELPTYTLTYDANGGSGAPSKQSGFGAITLSKTKPTKSGYTFLGWSYSSSSVTASYQPGETLTLASNTILYAVWEKNTPVNITYTLTYNANGGTGAPASQKGNGNITLSNTKPTKEGFTFLGWATSSNATTAQYQAGAAYSLTKDSTLYAVWKKLSYTLKYDSNGGSGAPSNQTGSGSITISSVKPTREGYSFLGWATGSDATTAQYQAGAAYSLTKDSTLYAVWNKLSYTLRYDSNGGSGAPSNQTGYGNITLSSIKPTMADYLFLGWALNANATEPSYIEGSTFNLTNTTTLFAVWCLKGDVNRNGQIDLTDLSNIAIMAVGDERLEEYSDIQKRIADMNGDGIIDDSDTDEIGTYMVSYDLSYDANGGENAPRHFCKKGIVTISSEEPTREKYRFLGWSKNQSSTTAQYLPGDTIIVNGNITLYAVWEQVEFIVSFNANGGTGAPESQIKIRDKALLISETVPTRNNYVFVAWNTKSNGTGTTYAVNAAYTANSDLTLYAQWTEKTEKTMETGTIESYNIPVGGRLTIKLVPKMDDVYNFTGMIRVSNTGVTGYSASVESASGERVPIEYYENGLEDGCPVVGFNMELKGGTIYTLTLRTNPSLTAEANSCMWIFSREIYEIHYNVNGGTGYIVGDNHYMHGNAIISETVPTREGYTFLGWSKNSSAASAQYQPGDVIYVTEETTLYAVWKKND